MSQVSMYEATHLAPHTSTESVDFMMNESAAEVASKVNVESIITAVHQQVLNRRWPSATYRIQFHRDFTFRDAQKLADYWQRLGISDCYASPYFKATAGSSHGYDVVDHGTFNPELGTHADFDAFVETLHARRIGHILDFVPNHMGIASNENTWFQDVLENGPGSPFARFFDIDWTPLKSDLQNKVLLPVLGQQFGQALEDQQLVLDFRDGTFFLRYYQRTFPIAPASYELILRHRVRDLEAILGSEDSQLLEYHSILTAISHLPPRTESNPDRREERLREKEVIKRRIQRLCLECVTIRDFIVENVRLFNGQRGVTRSFDLLDDLLQQQVYRLSFWRVAADEINYRRFFDVNELAAICMERPEVFEKTHALIWRLFEANQVDGIRIDHADGLYDPTAYLWQLQERRFLQLCQQEWERQNRAATAGHDNSWNDIEPEFRQAFAQLRLAEPNSPLLKPLFLVVEKILERTERLPDDWPLHGTTGYEFLNELNGLFVDGSKAKEMDAVYTKFIGHRENFRELTYEAKRLILKVSMSSELHVLGNKLDRISERSRWTRDFTLHGLIQALREVISCFPIYRTYTTGVTVLERDRDYIEHAVAEAKHRNPAASEETFDFIRSILLHNEIETVDADERQLRQEFVGRFQQFTGPMMAKAVEDTAFYRFNRLASLNEVGGDPERYGVDVQEFHDRNRHRQTQYPHGLLATSTHDTKRSEDVRARINVLSEIPSEWKTNVLRWARLNRKHKVKVEGELAPSRNDEYLLYQTLVCAWPLISPSGIGLSTFVVRIQEYMRKAVREAKVFTSWIAPNQRYEQALDTFIEAILVNDDESSFGTEFETFTRKITRAGFWNSLSQTLIKLTSPGVPDIYQGTELWNFCLVDPDNRRSVDFESRKAILMQLSDCLSEGVIPQVELVRQLMATPEDSRIKLFLTWQTLSARRRLPGLFDEGRYIPLEVTGPRSENLIAYARLYRHQLAIVAAPRLIAAQTGLVGRAPLGAEFWKETEIQLPPEIRSARLQNLLPGNLVDTRQGVSSLPVAPLMELLPVSLLIGTI